MQDTLIDALLGETEPTEIGTPSVHDLKNWYGVVKGCLESSLTYPKIAEPLIATALMSLFEIELLYGNNGDVSANVKNLTDLLTQEKPDVISALNILNSAMAAL